MLAHVLSHYTLTSNALVQPFGSGLINSTWKVVDGSSEYILQKINTQVFKQPEYIAENINALAEYLQANVPKYLFVSPVKTTEGQSMVHLQEHGYFRLFPFVPNSHTLNVTQTPRQALEAAHQFASFTKVLCGFQVQNLKITLPHFHDLSLRFQHFKTACIHGNPLRINGAKDEIATVMEHARIVTTYEQITRSPAFRLRVTHHDTKISNVLFNDADRGICVIDLDTVMPGYYISDVGDMMRTYLSPVSEEEKDFTKIEVRDAYFEAIVQGYLKPMLPELSSTELSSFFYSGLFMVYMQAVRFLTDHLNDDVYYGATYQGHNLVRAQNQLVLLQRLLEKEETYNAIVQQVAHVHLISS